MDKPEKHLLRTFISTVIMALVTIIVFSLIRIFSREFVDDSSAWPALITAITFVLVATIAHLEVLPRYTFPPAAFSCMASSAAGAFFLHLSTRGSEITEMQMHNIQAGMGLLAALAVIAAVAGVASAMKLAEHNRLRAWSVLLLGAMQVGAVFGEILMVELWIKLLI